MKNSIKILILGFVIILVHTMVHLFVLKGIWNMINYLWLDAVIVLLSFGIMLAVEQTAKKDSTKIGITYSLLGMGRLLIVATTILIISKNIIPELKTPLIVHLCLPIAILLAVEALAVKKILANVT